MRARTTILITHRQTLAAADRVLVLGGPGVVERLCPAELRDRGGAFAALFSS